jgi:phosphatidylserine decarboxylase
MARSLREWVESEVRPVEDKPMSWLSQHHFFRDPIRPTYSDSKYFFSPADGILVYQKVVDPREPIVDVKGKAYSLQDAMRDPHYDQPSLVIGIFMTFYDVHVNRIPYAGRVKFRSLEPIHSYNRPMLALEKAIVEDLRISMEDAHYLHVNERMINRVDSSLLGHPYYMLQIGDYDVGTIVPFVQRQNHPFLQGQRFSQVRYGSQVDLVIPLSPRWHLEPVQPLGWHVEAGLDPLVKISEVSNVR